MKTRFGLACLLVMLSACNTVPKQGISIAQHDLGKVFPSGGAKSPVAMRSIAVMAQPLINGVGMQYRDEKEPTRRSTWANNRWAATPAAMTEAALNRLLANESRSRCRLLVSLAEFIVEIDAGGKAQAVLVADLRLTSDAGQSAQTAYDLRVPLARVDPSEGALAFREALQTLGERSARWLAGPPGQLCQL